MQANYGHQQKGKFQSNNGNHFGYNSSQTGNNSSFGSQQGGYPSRGRGRNGENSGNRIQCQLCGKLGHVVMDYWHRFDQNFTPTSQFQNRASTYNQKSSFGGSNKGQFGNNGSDHIAMLAIGPEPTHDPSWYPNSNATDHLLVKTVLAVED